MKRSLKIVLDNAMLFKDLTQWMRKRTFQFLFFGLLFLSEVICGIIMLLPTESPLVGVVLFNILFFIQMIYSLSIAGMAYNLTAREFQNRTFELYEISGMSLEKMVLGKFTSMYYQFLFGFFCLVPFMFVAYILGGVDFSYLFVMTVSLVLAAAPVYLFILFISLNSRIVKIGGLLRLIMLFFGVIFGIYIITGMIGFIIMGHGVSRGISSFMDSLVSLDLKVLGAVFVFFVFYFQVCLLLFYLCCDALSGVNDSRETQVKLLALLLTFTWFCFWLGLLFINAGAGEEIFFLAFIPAFSLWCGIGWFYFYNRFDAPVVARKRKQEARGIKRAVHYLFEPGARGSFRVFLLLMALVGIFWLLYNLAWNLNALPTKDLEYLGIAASFPLQIPFFLAVPCGILMAFRAFREKYKVIRLFSLLVWIPGAIGLLIIRGVFEGIYRFRDSFTEVLFDFLSLVVSPITSVILEMDGHSSLDSAGYIIRIFLGAIGLYIMWCITRPPRKNKAKHPQPPPDEKALTNSPVEVPEK